MLNYFHIVYFVCRGADGPIFVPDFDKPYVRNKEDNYFTLEVLAAILEKLSAESGKIGLNRNKTVFVCHETLVEVLQCFSIWVFFLKYYVLLLCIVNSTVAFFS